MFKVSLKVPDTKTHPQKFIEPKLITVEEQPTETGQCACHLLANKPGWCGVAGGGVPACDH